MLLVEDDERVRDFVALGLREEGYRVVEETNGHDGLAYFQRHRDEIAVVVTDIRMPRMDGSVMARAILKLDPSVRIIFMSGTAVSDELPQGVGTDFQMLKKPFTLECLARCVRKCL